MRGADDYEIVLERFRRGELDILIGTQMIAKGLHFPNVTLVGIINADLGLTMGWYVPTQSGRGSVTPFDFSILPLELEGKTNLSDEELSIQVHRKELEILQKYGWNTVGADGLFYNHAALGKSADAHNIGRQLQLMDFMRHGLHHGAQKSTSTTPDLTISSKLDALSSMISAMILPP